MILLFSFSALLAQELPRTVEDYYVANGEKYFVSVSLGQIGVILKENVSERIATEQFAKTDLKIARRIEPSQLYLLQLPKDYSRMEIVRIGWDLKKKYPQLIQQTGLVVTAAGTKNPFLVTDEIIVGLDPKMAEEEAIALGKSRSLKLAMANPFLKGNYLFTISEKTNMDPLTLSHILLESGDVEYAYPNFVGVAEDYSVDVIPNDPLFPDQWHLDNTGQNGGTVDADADLPEAWDITMGDPGTVIAVLENGGFDMSHPDLRPNLWVNPGEIPGNGIDDDGNTYIDDINGWDFGACPSPPTAGCGDADPSPADASENHATAVAGVAGAAGDNMLGVSGSCPDCRLMMLRSSYSGLTWDFNKSLAVGYASQSGAQIITNSWSGAYAPVPNTIATINFVAVNGRGGAGVVLCVAAGNSSVDICSGFSANPVASLPTVIAVSSSSNRDRKVTGHAFGDCVDILSPTRWSPSDPTPTGTLGITTTDRSGPAGYNNANPSCPPGLSDPADLDYTNCFSGTSSATPLVAGVAGLILTADPTLTRQEVQNLIQDTGDKIEHSLGNYSPINGFSTPGGGGPATHAYGRVNAFEAVRVVAPVVDGGRGGVDIFLRDNDLDWGNTEQPSSTRFEPVRGTIGWWRSMDIKVDAPPFGPAPTAATFDAFVDENPALGASNRVYVRVRNRGPVTASSVTVKVHWAQFGTSLPALAGDFWTAFPADPALPQSWASMGTVTLENLAYSGASVAGTGADAAQVAMFTFTPTYDAALSNHFCLLAMVDSPQDPVDSGFTSGVVDAVTPRNNNVTHRNYHNLEFGEEGDLDEVSFFVRNPFDHQILSALSLRAPKGWEASLDGLPFNKPFELAPQEEKRVTIKISPDSFDEAGEVTVMQEQLEPGLGIMGGLTFGYRPLPPGSPDSCGSDGILSAYLIGTYDLRKNAYTVLQVVNPTGRYKRFMVAFLDDNEKFLNCFEGKLSPNDLEEIDVRQYVPLEGYGVVKIISKDMRFDVPEEGLVAFKKQFYRTGWICKRTHFTESVLPAIPTCVLYGDYKRILEGCK